MRIALTVLVALIALLMLGLGVQWVFAPAATAQDFGITLIGPAALSTARGDLGGMFFAGAAMAVLSLVTKRATWSHALALLLGTIALARLVGFASEGTSPQALQALGAEVVMVAVLLLHARQQNAAAS